MSIHFKGIKAGDRVTYTNPQGQQHTARAQGLLLFPDHVVCDAGRGRPVVVSAANYVSHKGASK